MSQFLDDAKNIFEAAETACRTGQTPSPLTILVGSEGGIQMISDSNWPLASLQDHHGAQMVFRISENRGKVCLEGRAGTKACYLETETPSGTVRNLLSDRPEYLLVPAPLQLSETA